MRELAERLQTIFEEAYESNQPYATREENVDAVLAELDDAKDIAALLESLDEIKSEYKIGMDDEIDEVYHELQELQEEREIEPNNMVFCLEEQVNMIEGFYSLLEEIKCASVSEILDYFCESILNKMDIVKEYLVIREQENDMDIETLTDKIWQDVCECGDGDVDYVLDQYAETEHFTASLRESIRKVLNERQEEYGRKITEQMSMS